jgi:YidC/Oxa1 family membrane protein insertase
MEKRAFLAVLLSLLILVVYQEWLAHQYGSTPSSEAEQKIEKKIEPAKPKVLSEIKPAVPAISSFQKEFRDVRVETDRYVALFSSKGARLKSFALKQYRTTVEKNSPPVEIISHEPGVPYPLGLRLNAPAAYDDENLMYAVTGNDLRLTDDAKGSLTFEGQTPAGISLKKEFTFTGSSYTIDMDVTVGSSESNSNPSLLLTSQLRGPTPEAHFEEFLGFISNKLIRGPAKEPQKEREYTGTVSWAGFGYTYFLLAVLPDTTKEQKVTLTETNSFVTLDLASLANNQGASNGHYTLFIGPKDLNVLKSLGRGLERSINFGYFSFISLPLLYVLRFSHRFTGSYGIDIILLTLMMKLVTAPLTHKSYTSMKQMQKLQPQMERLKERFKDDKEKLNKEIMELYRRNKVNPLGGCLPMVLQIPIFYGLYNALQTPIELRHAPFMWIKDLSRPDWESLPVTFAGWSVGLPILTILMGLSMFIQQWMSPSAGDPNQKRMMMLMPIMFTVMFINFPSGLTIYWLVNNVLSVAQQYLVNRMDR